MLRQRGQRRSGLLGIGLGMLLALLAGCESFEESGPAPSGEIGRYKVGKPYQIKDVWYYPAVDYSYDETGIASWYGPGFHGRRTANGETYDQEDLTAAHPTLPMPTLVEVTNLENGRSLRVRINDRGPYHNGRIIDLSRRAAELLDIERKGVAKVRVRVLEDESRQLVALAQSGTADSGSAETQAPPPAVPVEAVTVEALPGGEAPAQPAPPQPSVIGSLARAQPAAAMPDGVVTQAAVGSSDIYVQAGAFTWYDNANRMAARLSTLGQVRIARANVEGTQFFRVQVGPVSSVEQADQLLDLLLDNGFTGSRVVVQ